MASQSRIHLLEIRGFSWLTILKTMKSIKLNELSELMYIHTQQCLALKIIDATSRLESDTTIQYN